MKGDAYKMKDESLRRAQCCNPMEHIGARVTA